jgi:hypothetical protein
LNSDNKKSFFIFTPEQDPSASLSVYLKLLFLFDVKFDKLSAPAGRKKAGANPTTAIYNAGFVKSQNTTNSIARF